MTTHIGPFELQEPLPALRKPRLLLSLQPWIDVGSVGSMSLTFLEEAWSASPLAQLARPGHFYDFTRYRPMLFRRESQRQVSIPNTFLHSAPGNGDHDWLFMHMLEPHANGDEFVDGMMALLTQLDVSEYAMVGSMYAPVPHTRPPVVSGGASDGEMLERLRSVGVRESNYEGPTTIMALLPGLALSQGIGTMTVVLQLPAYAQLERDYRGLHSMLGLLTRLYGLTLDLDVVGIESERQVAAINESAQQDPRVQDWVKELEQLYDSQHDETAKPEEPSPPLSPELERFIQDVERRWDEGEQHP